MDIFIARTIFKCLLTVYRLRYIEIKYIDFKMKQRLKKIFKFTFPAISKYK